MNIQTKKVFISYSHDNDEHKDWVRKLAEDLTRNAIETILDIWHLRIADDLGYFMEKSIRETDYTLLICTPTFADKVNNRTGGVTYEANLIIGSILNRTSDQTKYIPVLKEGLPNESIPMYMHSRLFVDFSEESQYDKSFETLLRRIYDAPLYSPPALGNQPIFSTSQNDNENYTPKAKVLVAGTGVINRLNEQIRTISVDLGKKLAQNKYGLITGGWPGVDEIVARAFSEELYKRNLPIENYLTQVIVKTKMPTYTGGNLVLVNHGEDEWIEPVLKCDAIVLINGIGGTYETAEYGIRYRKPIFPIADTGGDANRMYMKLLTNWDGHLYEHFDKSKFQRLGGIAVYALNDLIKLLDIQFSK